MTDYKYQVLWTALKDMLEVTSKHETFDGVFSKTFLAVMNEYEEKYEKLQEEKK